MTSTLQQEASRKLAFGQRTMQVAQRLLRAGLDHLYADGLHDAVPRSAAHETRRGPSGAAYVPAAQAAALGAR